MGLCADCSASSFDMDFANAKAISPHDNHDVRHDGKVHLKEEGHLHGDYNESL